MRSAAKEKAYDVIPRRARTAEDLVTFWHECGELLARAVPHFDTPCWYTLDPASLLITSHVNESMPEIPAEWLAEEYFADDVNKLVDVARSARGLSTLHEATGGDPTGSPRWHQNMAFGADQELIAGLRTRDGQTWGALGLYREPGRPLFDAEEQELVRALSPHLAEGARRALLVAEATEPDGPDAPGLVVVTERWEVESATPGVNRWLDDLPDGDLAAGRLPSAVLAVAGRAMRAATAPDAPSEVAVSRVLARSGSWVVLHGAPLTPTAGRARVAVIVEPAHPARIAPLLMAAYGLTDREQAVTSLVLQGSSTAEIAEELTISPHTVQQHLKAVFEKTSVRSRRELTGKVFFSHYEPRVRENESRARLGRPVRGGPAPLPRPRTQPPTGQQH